MKVLLRPLFHPERAGEKRCRQNVKRKEEVEGGGLSKLREGVATTSTPISLHLPPLPTPSNSAGTKELLEVVLVVVGEAAERDKNAGIRGGRHS